VVTVIGWDIGGANTKAAFLHTENGCVKELRTTMEYFPVWKNPAKLAEVLSKLRERMSAGARLDGVGLTMTAELSDAYQTKRKGVNHVLACAAQVFTDLPVFVLDVDAKLLSLGDATSETLSVAAANWAATGWLVAQRVKTCIIVDVGSTSTSIIPVIDGVVSVAGKTDLEKLMVGELVYTGSLRTNVAATVSAVPLRDGVARVASELFAQSGDVHLVLGNISEKEYTTETADGRGKSRGEALARLARVVCADMDVLTEAEIVQIAKYVYDRQVEQVAEGLSKVYARFRSFATEKVPFVVTGLGKDFIARVAAQKIGVTEIFDLEKLCLGDAFVYRQHENAQDSMANALPAVGVAMMAASKLEGRKVKWTQ
jgi:probable H4MPT-linked C1 transfer pathway protein